MICPAHDLSGLGALSFSEHGLASDHILFFSWAFQGDFLGFVSLVFSIPVKPEGLDLLPPLCDYHRECPNCI